MMTARPPFGRIAPTLTVTLVLVLSGCGVVDRLRAGPDVAAAAPDPAATGLAPAVETPVSGATGNSAGKSAADLDSTSVAEKQAALRAPAAAGERPLGKVVVALGSPAEPGLWLRSALAKAGGMGRVVTASGQSLALELRPGTGAAQLSLAAFQALGLGLTALPEVAVFGP